MSETQKKMKEAEVIYAETQMVRCPHCGREQRGWVGDPRGEVTNCDDCGHEYRVADSAEIELDN